MYYNPLFISTSTKPGTSTSTITHYYIVYPSIAKKLRELLSYCQLGEVALLCLSGQSPEAYGSHRVFVCVCMCVCVCVCFCRKLSRARSLHPLKIKS